MVGCASKPLARLVPQRCSTCVTVVLLWYQLCFGGAVLEIYVLPRVHERHPELSVEDVLAAFRSVMVDARRDNGTWVCIGLDGRGRDVEMVYEQRGDRVLIYHAMTPPTKKTRSEIARLRGGRSDR
jgi:hypothetical protein